MLNNIDKILIFLMFITGGGNTIINNSNSGYPGWLLIFLTIGWILVGKDLYKILWRQNKSDNG